MEQAYKEKGSHVYYKIGRVFLVIKKFPDLIIGFLTDGITFFYHLVKETLSGDKLLFLV